MNSLFPRRLVQVCMIATLGFLSQPIAGPLPSMAHAEEASAAIEISGAYARASGMNAKSGAAFMQITNHGTEPQHLIGAKADISRKTELHTHLYDAATGVMRMVHVEEGFEIPAGETLLMERGSHHVMFMGLTEPLENGANFPLTLIFSDHAPVTIDVEVDLSR